VDFRRTFHSFLDYVQRGGKGDDPAAGVKSRSSQVSGMWVGSDGHEFLVLKTPDDKLGQSK